MDATLLGRRLDRLRSVPGQTVAASRPCVNHAATVAAALGGESVHGVVILDANAVLPVNRTALAELPYGLPLDRPLVCLDLETTGLATGAGTLAFLVGLGWWDADTLHVRQLLLTDHADEYALLDALSSLLPADACLITYNGRTFDWPLVVARYRLHGRPPPVMGGHVDLLPIARGLWRHRTGSARLATIEAEVCAVRRMHDLPGALIPERYFNYLRTRRPELLSEIVEHNCQDIISLGLLVSRLANWSAEEHQPGDMYGLARAYSRARQHDTALEIVERALCPELWQVRRPAGVVLHRQLSAERARLLARLGRRDEALEAWLEIGQRAGPGAATAWLHVARYREHVERDVIGAVAACREAAAIAGRARAWGQPMDAVESDLERRLPRLARLSFRRRPVDRAA